MAKKRPMSARKLGKLERNKIVGLKVNVADAGCYVELTRANGRTEEAQLMMNYGLVVNGLLVSKPYGAGE